MRNHPDFIFSRFIESPQSFENYDKTQTTLVKNSENSENSENSGNFNSGNGNANINKNIDSSKSQNIKYVAANPSSFCYLP